MFQLSPSRESEPGSPCRGPRGSRRCQCGRGHGSRYNWRRFRRRARCSRDSRGCWGRNRRRARCSRDSRGCWGRNRRRHRGHGPGGWSRYGRWNGRGRGIRSGRGVGRGRREWRGPGLELNTGGWFAIPGRSLARQRRALARRRCWGLCRIVRKDAAGKHDRHGQSRQRSSYGGARHPGCEDPTPREPALTTPCLPA